MFDVLLGVDGDLYLRDGDIVLTESVSQAIKIRLRWFYGEWKFNTTYGLPYYEEVFIKGYNLGIVERRIKEQILAVEEVKAITYIKLDVNTQTRELKVIYTVQLTNGELLEGETNLYE